MPGINEEDRYVTKVGNFRNETGDGVTDAGTNLIVIEVDHKSQVSRLHISGTERNVYSLETRNQDGTGSETIKSFAVQELTVGDFEFPIVRDIGAQKEIAVVNNTELSDSEFAVNVEVEELRRR